MAKKPQTPKPAGNGWWNDLVATITRGVVDGFRPVLGSFEQRLTVVEADRPTDLAPLQQQVGEEIQKAFADLVK